MKYHKIVLFPSPFSRWSHSIVLKISADHWNCRSVSSNFHSASQSCPIPSANCWYVCFVYFAAIAQVWINLHRQHVFYTVMLWKGSQVPRSLGNIRKRTKKRLWRKSQSRSRRFSFHKHFTTFPTYFFFSITLLYHFFFYTFFTHNIYPYPHPRPTTSTHYPRPTTFSYTPQ